MRTACDGGTAREPDARPAGPFPARTYGIGENPFPNGPSFGNSGFWEPGAGAVQASPNS